MSEIEKGQVMTANRLRDGEVVFLTRSGEWMRKLTKLAGAEPQATKALEAGQGRCESHARHGPYLFDAERVGGKIRALLCASASVPWPTVRLDLGKQAEGTAGAFAFKEA